MAEVLLVIWTQRSRKPSDREISVSVSERANGKRQRGMRKEPCGAWTEIRRKELCRRELKVQWPDAHSYESLRRKHQGVCTCLHGVNFFGGRGGKMGGKVIFSCFPFKAILLC